ncbi:MAG TPA: 1-deoxy-D-xylulose-5-phosphate synthase [Candidatus Micrarchaeia archaeon]|nr:1-deoxy-D-xylulose-5-phosphate synthase [Candidatus Micrarchaeia archaeon]
MAQGTGALAVPGGPGPILGRIDGPHDCRTLTRAECGQLAQEIRDFLVESVTRTGGHLGPNLGIVELTLALHRVFDSPVDALIFDTGHQAYVHKLLTGRRHRFGGLRQKDGLSGYPSRSESDHDWVENSHASTALSYALGLAQARRRSGTPGQVVAVVGDGSLTGGMAYEALNNIGTLRPDLIVVLNDNGRSYAPTVGGLANHLARLRLDPHYQAAKSGIGDFLSALPGVGDPAHEVARRLKTGVKQLVAPQVFFEDLGLKYSGPIDGHDLGQVERALRLAGRLSGPVVVHVVTEKGRGYPPALADEIDKMHGVSALPAQTGAVVSAQPTYTDVFAECLLAAAADDPSLVAITAAMGSSTGLLEFARRYPDRFYDVGIAEQHAVTFAAGLAMGGAHPVVCIYSTFLQRAFDQVAMDVALHDLPVTFVLDRAGVGGEDGSSAHGAFDLSYLRCVPNLVLATPRDATELGRLLATGLRHRGPFALRYPKGRAGGFAVDLEPVAIGSWEVVRAGGSDVCIAAAGKMVAVAEGAATQLGEAGVRATVLNARFVKPLDQRLPDWAGQHRAMVTVEDGTGCGGLGAAVSEALAAAGVVVPVRHVAIPDRFLPHASQAQVLAEAGLTVAAVVAAARAAVANADQLAHAAHVGGPMAAARDRAAG